MMAITKHFIFFTLLAFVIFPAYQCEKLSNKYGRKDRILIDLGKCFQYTINKWCCDSTLTPLLCYDSMDKCKKNCPHWPPALN
ncbi:hypothetical protein P3L10_020165 [Capsicum annuum]